MLLIDDLADLVLARRCIACGHLGRPMCADCLADLRRTGVVRGVVESAPPVLAASGTLYAGTARLAMIEFKDHGLLALATPLATLLADAVAVVLTAHRLTGCTLVPVPAHRHSRRGFDPAGALANRASRELRRRGFAVATSRQLAMTHDYGPLKTLSRAERARRVANVFTTTSSRGGTRDRRTTIVVDDVLTTGATTGEAVRVLRAAGRRVTGVATAVATPAVA